MIYELMDCPTAQLATDLDHADFHVWLTHTVMPVILCQNTKELALPETCHDFNNMISASCMDNELGAVGEVIILHRWKQLKAVRGNHSVWL